MCDNISIGEPVLNFDDIIFFSNIIIFLFFDALIGNKKK
jgi:hypothetical protein